MHGLAAVVVVATVLTEGATTNVVLVVPAWFVAAARLGKTRHIRINAHPILILLSPVTVFLIPISLYII
jgi:hypothetical protein